MDALIRWRVIEEKMTCPTQHYFCKHSAACFPHFLMREKEMKAETESMAQAQEMTDSEWEQIELRAETAQMIEEVERMLEKDRLDQEYTEEMAHKDREDLGI